APLERVLGEGEGGPRDRERRDQPARGAEHRRRRAAEAGLAFLDVDCVPLGCDAVQVLEQLVAIGERARRARRQPGPVDHFAVVALALLALRAGEEHLAERGAVRGQRAPHAQARLHQLGALLAVQVDDLELAQLAQVRRLAGAAHPLLQYRGGHPQHAPRGAVRAAELQAAHADPVGLVLADLLDVALLLERGQDPEHVVLVEPEPPGELGHAELALAPKLLQHPEGIPDRLDHVVALGSSHGQDVRGSEVEAGAPALGSQVRFLTFSQSARKRSRPMSVSGCLASWRSTLAGSVTTSAPSKAACTTWIGCRTLATRTSVS